MSKERIIELQKSLKIAKAALEHIKAGTVRHMAVAEEALDEMRRLEPKQKLQYLVGHEKRPRDY